jgi:hypothetical protein
MAVLTEGLWNQGGTNQQEGAKSGDQHGRGANEMT